MKNMKGIIEYKYYYKFFVIKENCIFFYIFLKKNKSRKKRKTKKSVKYFYISQSLTNLLTLASGNGSEKNISFR